MHSNREDLEFKQDGSLKDDYSKKCSDIYAAILRQEASGVDEPGWVKIKAEERDITIWTFTDSEGHYKDYTGSDGRLIVKIFGEDSYDHVKTEDFLQRGELLYKAVASNVLPLYVHPFEQNQFKEWLEKHQGHFKMLIKKKGALDNEILKLKKRNPQDDKLQKEGKKHFDEKYNFAQNLLSACLSELVEHLQKAAILKTPGNIPRGEAVLQAIIQAEKDFVADRGRSAIVKIGRIKDAKHGVMMMSAQFPQGARTLPSSIREGYDEVALSNHVLDCSGIVDAAGQIKIAVLVDGHSSYPPIEEKNVLVRRLKTYKALLEKIKVTAEAALKADPSLSHSKGNPLTLSLSSLMMLSPSSFNKAERAYRKKESENAQLADIHFAFELLRSEQPQLIIAREKGDALHVIVDHSYMNLPVNFTGIKYTLAGGGDVQNYINERGFYEHRNRVEDALKAMLSKTPDLAHFGGKYVFLDSTNKNITPLEKRKLNKIKKIDKLLLQQYQELKKLYVTILNLENYGGKVSQLYKKSQVKLKNLEANIAANELKVFKKYKTLNNLHKNQFNENKKILKLKLKEDSERATHPKEKQFLLLLQRQLHMQDLFYNNKYAQTKNIYKFHVLYLLTNAELGRHLEAFCKSAEDRTGWLRITLLAHLAFQQLYGKDPDFSQPDEKDHYDKFFAAAAHELSASLDNTYENSNSPGLQVEAELTSSYSNIKLGKKMAGLAKNIFENVLNLNPILVWEQVQTVKLEAPEKEQVPQLSLQTAADKTEKASEELNFHIHYPSQIKENTQLPHTSLVAPNEGIVENSTSTIQKILSENTMQTYKLSSDDYNRIDALQANRSGDFNKQSDFEPIPIPERTKRTPASKFTPSAPGLAPALKAGGR